MNREREAPASTITMRTSIHGRISLLKKLIHSTSPYSSRPLHYLSPFISPISIKPKLLILPSIPARFVRLNAFSTTVTDFSTSDLSSPYLSVHVRCRKNDAEALTEALLCFGANSAYMDDLSDYGDFDEVSITSIYPEGGNVSKSISDATSSIGLDYKPNYEISIGKQSDWVANVQESFKPTEIIDGLWIVPTWRESPDSKATNIFLNPGLAFGTGEHATTKLCLLLLHNIIKGGEKLLDYGTGSGILSIAALKMGAELSVGIDIDPIAITSARENASLNAIGQDKMLACLVSDKDEVKSDLESKKGTFDVVVANILLNPLIELAEDIVSYGKPGSVFGLSGILTEQVPEIKEIYVKYLDDISISEMDGWACLHGVKKQSSEALVL
ncbi:hypothetical protein LUZ60_001451 [Juncus effusus]|nr:hypothetical protein LUZ60_001451 [Juncus effusus]